MELVLPLTPTGRKYGYIMWAKAEEPQVRALVGEADSVALLLPGAGEKQQRIDWKHRRISVGYSLTRQLPQDTTMMCLRLTADRRIEVTFTAS